MKISVGLLTAAIALGFPGLAFAEDLQGPYIGLNAGASYLERGDIKTTDGTKIKMLSTTDLAGGLNAGYAFGNGFRAEVEGLYRNNPVSKLKFPDGTVNKDGRTRAFGGIASGYYDFDTGSDWTPFLGAGIGGIVVQQDNLDGLGVAPRQSSLAYQGSAGLGYNVSPELNIGVQYKYLATPTWVKFKSDAIAGGSFKTHYQDHALLLGVRYSFGQEAAPAPAPVAAPMVTPPPPPPPHVMAPVVVPQTYLVFFDFNKSTITSAAEQVIGKAAEDAKKGKPTQIIATGHTDTVGSAKYNQALSVRRAEAVKAQLIRKGVPANEIVTVGKGKSEPRVATADNVREPQNRRVEVIFK